MRLLTLLVVVSACWSSSQGIRIDKSTGAYEDIVVAIDKSVEPDERIIDNIKALFRSASTFLHRATRGLVHFGSVTIAVPDTWPARPQAKSTTANLFPVADVRVAAENPWYGDTPYTLQPRGCGERGEYVHLTPRFLGELNDSIAEVYGSPAYSLVHEWAHFRYGVFDEYGDPESYRYPSLYCEFGKVRASTCSQRHKFKVYTDSGEPCRIYKGCRVSSKCKAHFLHNGTDPVTSSIMFMPYIDGVSDFCDKGGDKRHNAHAPNKHNHLCERKSTWEVISANEDFKGLASADPSKTVEVKFTEVQKREGTIGRVIFALDLSSSMSKNNRIGHLKEAASHYLRAIIPDGLEVGLVTFSSSAYVEAPLTTIERSTREQLVGKVQRLREDGFTCIGCALEEALQVSRQSRPLHGALMPRSPASAEPAVGTVAAPTDEAGGIPLDHFVYVDQDIEQAEPQVVSSEKAPQFERYAEGGSFRLGHDIDGLTIPPGSIQDLSVEDSFVGDNGEHVVLLTWTCPGAHLSSGNASRVELRASTLLSDLIRDFDSALEIRDNSTEHGRITPGAAGSRQRQRFSVPDELLAVARKDSLLDFYFASRVWNDVGLSSPVSNVARVTFQRPPPLAGSANGLPTWAIALIVVAAVIAVIAVVAAAIVVVKRRSSD